MSSWPEDLVTLEPGPDLWSRIFTVAPLVLVGTREEDGSWDLAPKHMAMPLGWSARFGFICTPKHGTYRNALREGGFTVSYPRPSQLLSVSLAAAPRCDDSSKPALAALPVFEARSVKGPLLQDAYLHLECRLDRTVDDLDGASLVMGEIVAAHAASEAVRRPGVDDADLLAAAPLLAYLYPGRWSKVDATQAFPFHKGFSR